MKLRKLKKMLPSGYTAVDIGGKRCVQHFERRAKNSDVFVRLEGMPLGSFMPELNSRDLRSLASEHSCIVEARTVAYGDILCRHFIEKIHERDGHENYLLYANILYGKSVIKLAALGIDKDRFHSRKLLADLACKRTTQVTDEWGCSQRQGIHGKRHRGMSDDKFYDSIYPNHPLSLLRKLLSAVVDEHVARNSQKAA